MAGPVRLIPFQYNVEDTYVLEFGDRYMRVIRQGAQVITSGLPVEIETPYLERHLFDLRFTQSADVMTIVHPEYVPRELSRSSHYLWKLEIISFAPSIPTPTGLQSTGGTGAATDYKVTAVASDTLEESLPATVTSVDLGATLTWNPIEGAESYNIYKEQEGEVFAFVARAESTSYTLPATAFEVELNDTPPKARNPFTGKGNYPSTVTYYEQRIVYGATDNDPQKLEFSQVGNFRNLNHSVPYKDDDAISLRLFSNQVNQIRHLVPLEELIVMTSGAEFKISSGDSPFTLTNIRRKPQGFRGSHERPPLVIGDTVLFVQNKGGRVRDLAYSLESDSYVGNDLSILSEHLFEGRTVADWAYSQEPYSIVWVVLDDGRFLGLTYQREHEVWAWHQHNTQGKVESVCVVSEGQEDVVYFVVLRHRKIGDHQIPVRYIERLHTRIFDDAEDAFFVDSGLTYDGDPATELSGLGHLEGREVTILADGKVQPKQTVYLGKITLEQPASKVHVGLSYTSDLETLEAPLQGSFGRLKSTGRVTLKVLKSRGGWVGPDANHLYEVKQIADRYNVDIDLVTDDIEFVSSPTWENHGKVFIRQTDPLPLTVLSIIPDVSVGG